MTTTNNTFAALPASEETSDFSRDVSYASIDEVCLGDQVRAHSGDFAFIKGEVYWKHDHMIEVKMKIFGLDIVRPIHWARLKRVG